MTEYHRPRAYQQPHSSGGWTSKIKEPEDPRSGCRLHLLFLPCFILTWWRTEPRKRLSDYSYIGTDWFPHGPPPLWPHGILITPQRPTSSYHCTGEQSSTDEEVRRGKHSPHNSEEAGAVRVLETIAIGNLVYTCVCVSVCTCMCSAVQQRMAISNIWPARPDLAACGGPKQGLSWQFQKTMDRGGCRCRALPKVSDGRADQC